MAKRKSTEGIGELVIKDGVPIPIKGGEPSLAALFRKMEIGQSVLIPGKSIGHISGSCQYIFGVGNYKSRAVEGGVRVWRTA